MAGSGTSLIEEAFPFVAASQAAAREKTLRAGHPSTLHPWFGRRSIGLCRAILHAQLVRDPGPAGRKDALDLTAEVAEYGAGGNYETMARARRARGGGRKPRFVDPFCGAGTIPLAARQLDLDVSAGDINPLAVLLTEAVAGIPSRFNFGGGAGKHALLYALSKARDAYVRELTDGTTIQMTPDRIRGRRDLAGLEDQFLPVVAWLWVRTVRSPSPAFADVHVPLLPSYVLSTAPGREICVRPVVDGRTWRFEIRQEKPGADDAKGLRYAKRGTFKCLLSGQPIPKEHIRSEIAGHRNARRLLAVVVQGPAGRVYLTPTDEDEKNTSYFEDIPVDPMLPIATDNPMLIGPEWGFTRWGQFFDHEPFARLQNLATHIRVARAAAADAIASDGMDGYFPRGVADDERSYADGGQGREAMVDAVTLYCALAASRTADRATTLCTWDSSARSEGIHGTFQHRKTNMAWSYAQGLLGGEGTGSFRGSLEFMWKALEGIDILDTKGRADVKLGNTDRQKLPKTGVVATDPPYLGEASHADTTDFHYPFLRMALRDRFPDLFKTMSAPKLEEYALHPALHGSPAAARAFVLDGLAKDFRKLASIQNANHPATLLYTLTEADAKPNVGMPADLLDYLVRLLDAGWDVRAAWPLRPDLTAKDRAFPHSLVVVCRKAESRGRTLVRSELEENVRKLLREAEELLPSCTGGVAVAETDAKFAAFGRCLRALAGAAGVLRADGTAMSTAETVADVWRQIENGIRPPASITTQEQPTLF